MWDQHMRRLAGYHCLVPDRAPTDEQGHGRWTRPAQPTGGGVTAVPALQRVASGVWLVTFRRGAAGSNVYLIGSGSTWTLVDAGWGGSAEAIRTAAESVFGPGAHPAAILLTHIHPDHSGSAGALARSWQVPVYVHANELPMAAGKYLPQYAMPLDGGWSCRSCARVGIP
jgi:glyoxylase-like metal-dependent hydrolase (beta-lactamase superfamily II)